MSGLSASGPNSRIAESKYLSGKYVDSNQSNRDWSRAPVAVSTLISLAKTPDTASADARLSGIPINVEADRPTRPNPIYK